MTGPTSGAFQRLRARLGIFDLHERVDALERELQALRERDDEHTRIQTVWATTEWVAHASPTSETLVSVVLATRDRRRLLPHAIDSVLAQSHGHWELLVVDDASTDGTADYLAAQSDPRIRSLTATGTGLPAARNAGLDAATGGVITYLDDDNRMAPHWLRGVAWAFDRDASLQMAYGAAIVDDLERVSGRAGGMPAAIHVPYSRERVLTGPMADIGVMAHRAGIPDTRFDDRYPIHGDWDLFIRLSRDREPLALPVVASFYATSAPARLQDRPERGAELAAIAAEHRP